MTAITVNHRIKLEKGTDLNQSNQHFACSTENLRNYCCGNCDYSTPLKVVFLRHNHNPNSQKPVRALQSYFCDFCKNFRSYSALLFLRHQLKCRMLNPGRRKNISVWFECGECSFGSHRRHHIKSHSKHFHKSEDIWCKCLECGHRVRTAEAARNHILCHHISSEEVSLFECPLCPYTAKLRMYLITHLRKHKKKAPDPKTDKAVHAAPDEVQWFQCEQCPYKAKRQISLQKHAELRHTDPLAIQWFELDQCSLKSSSKFTLRKDWHKTLPTKYFSCKYCFFRTLNRFALGCHVKNNHKPKPRKREFKAVKKIGNRSGIFLCDRCGFLAKRSDELRIHIVRFHTASENTQSFECDQCPYKAKFKRYLKKHVKLIHAEEIVWLSCPFCDYKAKQSGHLSQHITAKHTEKKDMDLLKCTFCSYTTGVKKYLKNHMKKMHCENAPPVEIVWFPCEFCDYKTTEKRNLVQHIKVRHTDMSDLEVLRCPLCPYSSVVKKYLNGHMRNVHEQRKSKPSDEDVGFSCEFCDYKVKRKRSLVTHVKSRHTDKLELLKCPLCSYSSVIKKYLDGHIKNIHRRRGELVNI